jgi:hypothetical protein
MRDPDLTDVAHRPSVNDLRIKIANGGGNMPSLAGILTHDELDNSSLVSVDSRPELAK